MADPDFAEPRYWTPSNGSSVLWSKERTEQLKVLHAKGLSSNQIAQEMGGGLTRNAVIGKVHRLGLKRDKPQPLRRSQTHDEVKRRRNTHARLERRRWHKSKEKKRPAKAIVAEIESANPIGFFELTPSNCHWPVGEATGVEQLFCGQPRAVCSYCETHARKAYYPASRLRAAA